MASFWCGNLQRLLGRTSSAGGPLSRKFGFTFWMDCWFRLRRHRSSSNRILTDALSAGEPLNPSPYFTQGWEFAVEENLLPDWYEPHRVQGSTRLPIKPFYQKTEFKETALAFKELGAKVYMRHVKNHDEDPWWRTSVPFRPESEPLDLIHGVPQSQQCEHYFTVDMDDVIRDVFASDAHEQSLGLIGYYRHMSECRIAQLHPEWVCRESDGSLIPESNDPDSRGYHLDLTTPYREIVKVRLIELAERGVKGFNFDERHLPPHGAWGTKLGEDFLRETGLAVLPEKNIDDESYRQFLDFQAHAVEATFVYWKKEVKARFKDVVFSISTTSLPCLSNRRMTTNLVRIADGAKNEYHLATNNLLNFPMEDPHGRTSIFAAMELAEPDDDIRMALGWTMLRDSADGRPPRIWAPNLPNKEHAYAFAASLIAYGAIANMNVSEALIHDILTHEATAPAYATPRDGLEAAFELGNQVSEHLSRTLPHRWAAVHFSELARNRRLAYTAGGLANMKSAWDEVLWPVTGAFGVFVREGLPVGVINDHQLERNKLGGYRVLFLPNPNQLTSNQRRNVANFVARGGILMSNPPGLSWSDLATSKEAAAAFTSEVQDLIVCRPPPVQVLGGPERMHAVAFTNSTGSRLVIAITNDFSWVQTQTKDRQPAHINTRPSTVSGVEIVLNTRGRPLSVMEVVSDSGLTTVPFPSGFRVSVPEFDTLALVVIKF
jgi:hypothetical protein